MKHFIIGLSICLLILGCDQNEGRSSRPVDLSTKFAMDQHRSDLDSLVALGLLRPGDQTLMLEFLADSASVIDAKATYGEVFEMAKARQEFLRNAIDFELLEFAFEDLDSKKATFVLRYRLINRTEKKISQFSYLIDFFDLPGDFILSTDAMNYSSEMNPLANSQELVDTLTISKNIANEEDFILNVERMKSLTIEGKPQNFRFATAEIVFDSN
jgi:hypothetical protein